MSKQAQAPISEVNLKRQLMRFYRTGEQSGKSSIAGLRSVFEPYFSELRSKYPFQLEHQELPHNDELVDQLIVHHLHKQQHEVLGKFKQQLNDLIEALSTKLSVRQDEGSDEKTYAFASQMIAFEKLAKVVPEQDSAHLSDARKTRLTKVLKRLKRGLKSYKKIDSVMVRSLSSYATVGTSDHMKVITASRKHAFEEVRDMLSHNMKGFTTLMRSFHIALLEVGDEYQDEVHNDYFKHFSWYWLSEDEKQLMQPVFLMLDYNYIQYHLEDLSELLSTNWPVKVLVLHAQLMSTPAEGVKWEEASHRVRQEMATFAISHRSVVLNQLTSANPERLSDTIQAWIQCTRPSLIHLLMPEQESTRHFLTTCAATYSRYFPVVSYDPRLDPQQTSRWSLHGNPGLESVWPVLPVAKAWSGKIGEELAYTYADYKALSAAKVKELMVISEKYEGDELVQLADYLPLQSHKRIGKVPFIYLIDDQQKLHRAVVPYLWVVSCQERMEFWTFLQGIAGSAVKKDPNASSPTSDKQPEAHAAQSEKEKEEMEQRAFVRAAERLIQGLLDENS